MQTWKLFNIEMIAEIKRGTCGKEKAENMALENRKRNEIKEGLRTSKDIKKEHRDKTGKHIAIEVNEKKIYCIC